MNGFGFCYLVIILSLGGRRRGGGSNQPSSSQACHGEVGPVNQHTSRVVVLGVHCVCACSSFLFQPSIKHSEVIALGSSILYSNPQFWVNC